MFYKQTLKVQVVLYQIIVRVGSGGGILITALIFRLNSLRHVGKNGKLRFGIHKTIYDYFLRVGEQIKVNFLVNDNLKH